MNGQCCNNCANKRVCIAAEYTQEGELQDNFCYCYTPEPKKYSNKV